MGSKLPQLSAIGSCGMILITLGKEYFSRNCLGVKCCWVELSHELLPELFMV